jgi:V8-like Glu-specific endopeptidase
MLPRHACSSLVLLCAAACGGLGQLEQAPSEQREPVVYGADDRSEIFENTDAQLVHLAQNALVAVVRRASLIAASPPSLSQQLPLCDGERFAGQPSLARCSALLVSPRLVLTAGHCVTDENCPDTLFVRGFYYDGVGVLHERSSGDVFGCTRVLAREGGPRATGASRDYAWVEIDPEAEFDTAFEPIELAIRTEIHPGDPVAVLGFPEGVPAKLDARARVLDWVDDDTFVLESDTFHGSSGSPIFDHRRRLIGVLGRGVEDYEKSESGCYATRVLPEGAAAEQATTAAAAVSALCGRCVEDDCRPSCLNRADRRGEIGCTMLDHDARRKCGAAWAFLVLLAWARPRWRKRRWPPE